MKKLLRGIIDFRKNLLPSRREMFARLATGQSPDVLWVTCSDSRVAPNWFASTDPGDLFVVRNIGNLVPPCNAERCGDESVSAAVEFAVLNLGVKHIIVCGHSECGAMATLSDGSYQKQPAHLRHWLTFGEPSLKAKHPLNTDPRLNKCNSLSQVNVLQQIENLKTHPVVRDKVTKGELRLHAWWFEIGAGSLYSYDEARKSFILIDEDYGMKLLEELNFNNSKQEQSDEVEYT